MRNREMRWYKCNICGKSHRLNSYEQAACLEDYREYNEIQDDLYADYLEEQSKDPEYMGRNSQH